ncbi:hypothetical protein SEPCBS119000_001897 [Sporothrix epigloea]|uniref:Regulatory factor Sgt1 n=1 Tax=Sporothrix epigloea TaxID=1892477 RepID=A0ABP0DD86_9PEZI
MKLTFGFEILALSAEKSNSRVVREVGLILQDLAEDGDDPAVLPSDDEIRSWPNANRESDDSWLDINFEDFERELQGNPQSQSRPRTTQTISTEAVRQPNSGFGDANVQTDLRRIVSQFQSFLNDTDAGIDGADFDAMDEDDGSDDDVNEDTEDDSQDSEDETDGVTFDEAKFSRLLRDTLGLSTSDAATDEARAKSTGKDAEAAGILYSPDQDDENELDDKEDEILELAAQFEAELRDHGALSLSSPKHAGKLGLSSPKSTEAGGEVEDAASTYDQESDDEGELDVDYNLAKNLLESFKAQEGMSGPAGNILAMLGLALPRDEDEEGKGK